MDDINMENFKLRTVICHTENCINADIPITFECLDLVICGGCSTEINDIVVKEA